MEGSRKPGERPAPLSSSSQWALAGVATENTHKEFYLQAPTAVSLLGVRESQRLSSFLLTQFLLSHMFPAQLRLSWCRRVEAAAT